MLLFWPIRYLDTRDRQFKDRHLWLDTGTLEPVTKAIVEAIHELRDMGKGREMLPYRHLFQKRNPVEDVSDPDRTCRGSMGTVFIHDYFEDENGNELSRKRMGEVLTGNPNGVLFPAGSKQYDREFALSDGAPIAIDQITMSRDSLDVLGYFARDLRELLTSALFRDGPGTLSSCGASAPTLQTAATDEEIRSFVTIFRRLYMQREPANFRKAVAVFAEALDGCPLAEWVKAVAGEYDAEMVEKPYFVPFAGRVNWPFSRKRLIDVFLYTQYAHQPDAKSSHQFEQCLQGVDGNQDMLTWLFLTELWRCSVHMSNAGRIIANFYERYCQHHKVAGSVLGSVSSESTGIGTLEKKEARRERILGEKAGELAKAMWENDGRPEGGYYQYVGAARAQLNAATGKIDVRGEVAT